MVPFPLRSVDMHTASATQIYRIMRMMTTSSVSKNPTASHHSRRIVCVCLAHAESYLKTSLILNTGTRNIIEYSAMGNDIIVPMKVAGGREMESSSLDAGRLWRYMRDRRGSMRGWSGCWFVTRLGSLLREAWCYPRTDGTVGEELLLRGGKRSWRG